MNCLTNFASKCAPKPSWPTGFEKSRIHQPNPEKLQFIGSKIWAFLLIFQHFPLKLRKIAWILLPLNCNFSGLGWWILDFSKPVGQGGFGAHSETKLVKQFLQTKLLCNKMSQNSTVRPVSSYSDCISVSHVAEESLSSTKHFLKRWVLPISNGSNYVWRSIFDHSKLKIGCLSSYPIDEHVRLMFENDVQVRSMFIRMVFDPSLLSMDGILALKIL